MDRFDRIKQELLAPIESIRIFALEELIKFGGNSDLLELLKELQKQESSEECRLLFDYAISKLQSKDQINAPCNEKQDPDSFWKNFSRANNIEKLILLNQLKKSDCEKLSQNCLKFTLAEKHPAVLRKLLSLICSNCSTIEISRLKPLLHFPAVGVRMAALQLFIQKSPEALTGSLPKLLRSKDFNLRNLAIRGLAKLDQATAMSYFEHFLFKGNELEKKAILSNSIFFDFSDIKEKLIRFLIIEKNPEFLNSASLILINNPDIEVVQQLWLYLESCPKGKKEFISAVLNECCKQLEVSDSKTFQHESFNDFFENWKNNIRFSREVISDVGELIASEFSDIEIRTKISQRLNDSGYKEAFKRFVSLKNKKPEYPLLQELLNSSDAEPLPSKIASLPPLPESSPVVTESQEISIDCLSQDFTALSDEEKSRQIALLDSQGLQKSAEELKKLLATPEVGKKLILSIFKIARRHECNLFLNEAKSALKSLDPAIVSAALEYIPEIDPEWFFSIVGKFIRHENKQIKRATIKSLKAISLDKAIAAIQIMLRMKSKTQTMNALACMIYFDFNFIRELVKQIAIETPDPDIFSAAMILYQNNPEPGNLFDLYFLEKKAKQSMFKEQAREIRRSNQSFLIDLGLLKPEDINEFERTFSERITEFENKKSRMDPACKLENTIALTSPKQILFTIKDLVSGFSLDSLDLMMVSLIKFAKRPASLAIFFLLGLITWGWLLLDSNDQPLNGKGVSLAAEPIVVSGKIVEVSPKRAIFALKNGERMILKPMRGRFSRNVKSDRNIRLRVLPLRKNSNNEIFAVCMD